MIEKPEEIAMKDLHHVLSQLGDEPLLEELEQDIIELLLPDHPVQSNDRQSKGLTSAYNRIPSTNLGSCHPVLMVFCCKSDNFDKRLEEIAGHIEKCPATERVYFVTTKWRPDVWGKHERSFRLMPAKLTIIIFAMGRFVLLSSA